ncbi:MAG TPA: 50S ribosomal protein L21 [Phycisphaerae bacterium]|nr:50S ribosomal protein L21 [Phycisphaerae bacterium]
MYAIIEDSGRQYKVQQGDAIEVDLRPVEQGQQTIEFDRVLMVGGTDQAKVGTPVVEGAKVVAQLAGEVKGRKLDVIKFRRRKGYRVKIGHRQRYLRVTVSDIQV